ncbi:hypothetical protein V6M80_11715, partial [Enterococcus faecium]|uniref:hypothetical protein n=1 Tax=Enterococcus faecium TaxID=1352 RepID=UPI002FEFDCB7
MTEDKTKTHFQNDQWLNDRVSGFDRHQKAHNNDAGFSDWAQSSARDAAASDAARADAASKASKEQAVSNFNEDVWAKENDKKVISDRDQNEKVL